VSGGLKAGGRTVGGPKKGISETGVAIKKEDEQRETAISGQQTKKEWKRTR